jgi:hypothetical protein
LADAAHLRVGLGSVEVHEDSYGSVEELITLISSALLKENSLVTVGADGSAQLSAPPNPDLTQYTAIGRFLALSFLEGVTTAIPFPISFYASMLEGTVPVEMEALRSGFNDLVPIRSLTGQAGFTGADLMALNAAIVPDSMDLIDLSLAFNYSDDESARIPTPEATTQKGYLEAVYAGFDALTKKKFWRVMSGLNWIPATQYMVDSITIYLGYEGDGKVEWYYYNTQTAISLNLPTFESQDEMRVFLLKLIDTAIVGRL